MNKYVFAEYYDLSAEAINVRRSIGSLPDEAFIGTHSVNLSWWLRRWDFIIDVRNANQDLYYLLEEHFSVTEVARNIAKKYGSTTETYSAYFSSTLFSVGEHKVIRVRKAAWNVYRYWWSIERRLRSRGTSISAILDKRMNT